jgi:uncharacterized membrane protein
VNQYESIDHYLKDLEKALEGLDPALIADALDDAEEHLEVSKREHASSMTGNSEKEALRAAIEEYGLPSEIAEEYHRMEPEKTEKKVTEKRSLLSSIFGVYIDSRTYLNLAYVFLLFPLGIVYFAYIAVGALLSVALAVTIVGIPLGILFLLSIFGLSWFHGRMSETCLGIRMPRRKRKFIVTGTAWQKMKSILSDWRLYTSACYLVLMFPLGFIYFAAFVLLFSTAGALLVSPFAVPLGFEVSLLDLPFSETICTILYPVLGFLLLTVSLHAVRVIACYHGVMTKALLVKR